MAKENQDSGGGGPAHCDGYRESIAQRHPNAERQQRARELNATIDRCLLAPATHPPRELAACLSPEGTLSLVERVRRRATLLSRRDPAHAETALAARDALVLAIYAHSAPRGAFTAWCDGSSKKGAEELTAGIGGLLMDPHGRILTRLSRARTGLDAFAAEMAALQAVLHAAADHKAERLCVFTDCVALWHLWLEQRADPRLAQVRMLAQRFSRFELRALPRRHNQPANRLARQALAPAGVDHEARPAFSQRE